MAETILSPGVVTNENDQSFITQQPIEAGAAIIGPTVKGPVERPTIVTTYSEYVNTFGTSFISGSQDYTYFTSISAYNYFNNGGTSLLVNRVTSGSFTPATSSFISGSDGTLGTIFNLETISEGIIMNNDSTENADGSIPSGSLDNVRWQIVSPNISSGTFTLLIRRGDDDRISPVVLETWDNLSLDPTEPNYIEKIIGNQTTTIATDGSDTYIQFSGTHQNQSRYVRVSQVNKRTPYYLDNSGDPVTAYTSSIPIASSGSFGSALGSNISTTEGKYYEAITDTNTQGLVASDYTQTLNLLTNKDEYQFKYISTPGLVRDFASHASVVNSLITKVQERGDTMAIVDMLDYNANISEVVSEASTVNSSYAATYWPWLQTLDPNTGQQVWVPASTMMPSIYAFTDSISEPWVAPAGINRGTLSTVIKAERFLTQGNRNTLYEANINPIATFPNSGVTVFGQKTLQKKKSALDRVNVRRLLIELKSTIKQIADALVFEQNTVATRNDFVSQVNPYLSSVQQRQGLYTYRVVMDETNNTPTVIDNNQLVGAIYLQPVKTVEFIVLDFNVTQTGVTFE
tara:strand:- start:228 stop:1946 length:1719 start_codon:yes stop_codon:yes gene_type:complete